MHAWRNRRPWRTIALIGGLTLPAVPSLALNTRTEAGTGFAPLSADPEQRDFGSATEVLFRDDFEAGLGRWDDRSRGNEEIVKLGGDRGNVLRLSADGDVHVLIPGSERWGDVVVEGDFQFPEPGDSYLGLMYNYRETAGRSDFGLVYVKFGRRVYLQPNPHRDYNVTRTFYPELAVTLSGDAAVRAGEWQRFRMEVVSGVAHVYIGPGNVPQLTFMIPEAGPGRLGFQPRSVGKAVLLDNIVVRRLDRHSYQGPPIPAPDYQRGRELAWQAAGPYDRTRDAIVSDSVEYSDVWRAFEADSRGAIETARLLDFHGPNTVAYLRTRVHADSSGPAILRLSSVDDVALWVNGRFEGFYYRQDQAWHDHDRNDAHAGTAIRIRLNRGQNVIAVRVRGGTYAAGGFFAALDRGNP